MKLKLSNPIKNIGGSVSRLVKNPTNTAAWEDLAVGGATGGWYSSGKAEQEEKRKLAKALSARQKRESAAQGQRNQQAQQVLQGQPTGSVLSGTEAEQQGQLAGLNLGAIGYGQGLAQTGQDIQNVKKLMQARTAQGGADPVTAAIMGQKQSAQAQARRSLAGTGARGTAMAGAIEAVGRQKDQDIAASLYGQQRQSIQDERSLLSNILGGTTSLMQGEKAANVQLPSAPSGGGGFMGTVICTELFNQGYLSKEIYAEDANYGAYLKLHNPNVIVGYHFLADPVVKLMKKSKLFTKLISIPALKWAKHIAGVEHNIFGSLCVSVGEPVCALVGKVLCKLRRAYV